MKLKFFRTRPAHILAFKALGLAVFLSIGLMGCQPDREPTSPHHAQTQHDAQLPNDQRRDGQRDEDRRTQESLDRLSEERRSEHPMDHRDDNPMDRREDRRRDEPQPPA